jgi:hypothetical protein
LTLFKVKNTPSAFLKVQVKIRTEALSLVWMDDDHHSLVQRMLSLQSEGLNCRQIADRLNSSGTTSWTGKMFYPELVFGILRKAKLKLKRAHASEVTGIKCQLIRYDRWE